MLNRLLAPHPRKGDQTCELKAYALQKSPQNTRLRSKGVRSRMLGCPGCCMEHADRLLSASSCLGLEENIGLSVCLRKQKLRLEASGIRADVGDGMRGLQRFFISRGG